MNPVSQAFASPQYKRITFVMGTQMGKSATMQNVIGWRLDDDPAPIIYIGPTESNINNVVEPKIVEMFQQAESLWRKFDKKSTKHKKRVAGVSLRFAWAGSATELASDSAVITLVDELDRPPENATGEGSLEEIAEARGDAYADSKLGLTSTPTHGLVSTTTDPVSGLTFWAVSERGKVSSPIWLQWEKGTRHEWAVPHLDPACGHYFIPRSELLWWPGKDTASECSAIEASLQAGLICPHCGAIIPDSDRQRMNAKGIALAPGQRVIQRGEDGVEIEQGGVTVTLPYHHMLDTAERNDHFSIWISGLCSFSAKKSYGFLARKLIEARRSGNPSSLLSVYNTGFGEVYAIAGDVPDWEEVYALRSVYTMGMVPDGVETLIATVDVQKNRLVYVVRGWLAGFSSRLVECGELWGDTDKPAVWAELTELLARDFSGLRIRLMGVDCGYRTDEVHNWVRQHRNTARALMGFERLQKPFRMTRIEVGARGKLRKRGDKRWDFDASLAKAWVHGRITWKRDTPGDWLLPSDITEDYCRQIVAEEFNPETGKWRRLSRDNHYLDCEGMQYMCARMLRLDRKASKPSPDQDDGQADDDQELPEPPNKPAAKAAKPNPVRKKRRQGFVSRYR
jgi:phage terminase large subunit GpA-like protein